MRLSITIVSPLAVLAALALGGCSLFASDDSVTPPDPDGGIGGTCGRTDDCAGDLVCVAGSCAVEGSVGSGGRSSANRDCVTGLWCTPGGRCAAAGGGGEDAACSSGADCLRGFTCVLDGLAGTCEAGGNAEVGATCTDVTDCLAGLVCSDAGRCERAADVYPPFAGVTCVNWL